MPEIRYNKYRVQVRSYKNHIRTCKTFSIKKYGFIQAYLLALEYEKTIAPYVFSKNEDYQCCHCGKIMMRKYMHKHKKDGHCVSYNIKVTPKTPLPCVLCGQMVNKNSMSRHQKSSACKKDYEKVYLIYP